MEPSLRITLDAASSRSPGWQVAQRIQYVVAQVADAYAGLPLNEVTDALARRLRGLGVNVTDRDVQRYAQAIAELPRRAGAPAPAPAPASPPAELRRSA